MNDVEVHYASAAPAGLQALAYAQGTHIHLGPGQEKHLPHEAWHVVQQKQGRVQPSAQMKGLPVNDDSALEEEADAMAAKALQAARDGGGPAGAITESESARRTAGAEDEADFPSPVVQRKAEWKDDNHKDKFLDTFVDTLNTIVQEGATAALDPDGLADIDGYVTLWKDTAVILRAIEDDEIDKDNSDEVAEARAAISFAAARYGYAVESLASNESVRLGSALPAKCSYQLQATRGMTRPDIVVRHSDRGEIGWFDITSQGSLGHIDRKTGTGWKAKEYVAEITYPPLVASNIGASKLGIGERVARRNAMKRRVAKWEGILGGVLKMFRNEWESEDGDEKNKLDKQTLARRIAGEVFGVGPLSPQQTKSLIRALSLSVKDYGFDSGGTKAEGEQLIREHFGV